MNGKMKPESDGSNRRQFLKISTLGLGTLALAVCAPTAPAAAPTAASAPQGGIRRPVFKAEEGFLQDGFYSGAAPHRIHCLGTGHSAGD
jgi:hypothetical protein